MIGGPEWIDGADTSLLLVSDHASNFVPGDIDLRIDAALLAEHIAFDIGAGPLTRALAQRLGCPAILGGVSRLVVDLHRDRASPATMPAVSDGHCIAGNEDLSQADREVRLTRFWDPYHTLIGEAVERLRPRKLVAVHSFTPQLATRPHERRPWEVGILYAQDDRAAREAIRLLREAGVETGDNQPYSGLDLNFTMDFHAETRGLPYTVFEVRQDLIADEAGVERWADILAGIVRTTRAALPDIDPWERTSSCAG